MSPCIVPKLKCFLFPQGVPRPGEWWQLGDVPAGSMICNVEMRPNGGGQIARAAGTSCTVLNNKPETREKGLVPVLLPSREVRLLAAECWCTVGRIGLLWHVTAQGRPCPGQGPYVPHTHASSPVGSSAGSGLPHWCSGRLCFCISFAISYKPPILLLPCLYSIFQDRNAPKPAPKPAPEQARPKPRPRPEGAGAPARRAKRPKPAPKAAPPPPKPKPKPQTPPEPKPKPQTCPFFTPEERNTMHPEYPDGAEVQGVFGATLKGQPKRWVWFRGTVKYRLATPGKHGALQLKIAWQALPEWGEKAEAANSRNARYNSVCQRTRWHRVPSGQETCLQRGWRNPTSPRNNGWRRQ